jgi:cysteine desulfurase / selenocysteine lyase
MSLHARARKISETPLDRALFPITKRWAYCNHAAVGPLPQTARDAVTAVLDAQMNEGCAGILEYESHLEAIRAQTAAAIGATPDEVAFLRSTSDGALVAANGLSWREGDEIILPDSEFGANAYPWLNLRYRGVRVHFVRLRDRLSVELLERCKTPRTRLVAVSYVSFLDGYRYDLKAIGAWCRSNKILFAVDAMQGFGCLPLDVAKWHIDFCYFGVAKWLLSPQGLSVVFVRRDIVDSLRPSHYSWRSVRRPMEFLDYAQELADGARRLEGGTVNYPAVIGFRESLKLMRQASFEAIEDHVLGLTEYLIRQARLHDIEIKSDQTKDCRSGIVLLGLGDRTVEALSERAQDGCVGLTVRDSGVRVSPHGYNTIADIDAVIDIFAR